MSKQASYWDESLHHCDGTINPNNIDCNIMKQRKWKDCVTPNCAHVRRFVHQSANLHALIPHYETSRCSLSPVPPLDQGLSPGFKPWSRYYIWPWVPQVEIDVSLQTLFGLYAEAFSITAWAAASNITAKAEKRLPTYMKTLVLWLNTPDRRRNSCIRQTNSNNILKALDIFFFFPKSLLL